MISMAYGTQCCSQAEAGAFEASLRHHECVDERLMIPHKCGRFGESRLVYGRCLRALRSYDCLDPNLHQTGEGRVLLCGWPKPMSGIRRRTDPLVGSLGPATHASPVSP